MCTCWHRIPLHVGPCFPCYGGPVISTLLQGFWEFRLKRTAVSCISASDWMIFFVQTIGANTIIDGGQVFGHTVVYNNFFFGPNRVAGVLHEGTHMAHCTDTGKQEEIGPWRPFVGCVESVPNLDDDTDKAVSFGGDSDLT
mmetsp:Transcript_248/g.389  ORF Transcript_248/g.389 Transcript_248/m.389 type:complete len:141 (-) Transcript_248:35-457(-)